MSHHDIFVIAASAGGVDSLKTLIAPLPASLPVSIFVVLHIGRHQTNLDSVLGSVGALRASQPHHGEVFQRQHIYVAPPDHHLRIRDDRIWLDKGQKENFARPAADPLFRSAAESYGPRVVGIVLSGGDGDGARGLRAVKEAGGISVVQDPDEAKVPEMPLRGLELDDPDFCLRAAEISRLVVRLCIARDAA